MFILKLFTHFVNVNYQCSKVYWCINLYIVKCKLLHTLLEFGVL